MNSKTIAATNVCLQANIPANLIGLPGAAKTKVLESAIRDGLKWHLETIIVSTREPSDIGGLPMLTPSGVTLAAPVWVQNLAALQGAPGVAYFDEVNQAPPLMQGALMRVMLEGVAGDTYLGANVRRICAMNPTDISAGGFDLAPPLANRMCHIEVAPDRAFFLEALTRGFPPVSISPAPEGWKETVPGSYALLSAFLHAKPSLHHAMPAAASERGKPWPSWRTWTMGMEVVACAQAMGESEEIQAIVLGGLVGPGPAMEFIQYRRELDLPDPEDILKKPETFKLPDRQDRQYAVFASIVSAVMAKNTKKRWESAVKALGIGAKTAPDIALVFMAMLFKSMPDGAQPDDEIITNVVPLLRRIHGVK